MTDSEIHYATAEIQTFVDFKNRRYLSCRASDRMKLLTQLAEAGFNVIDEAIAYPLMVLNDNGCKTKFSCGGHIGASKNMYIMFYDLDKEIEKRFDDSKVWQREETPLNTVYRAHYKNYGEWLALLNGLYDIVKDKKHEFTPYSVVQVEFKDGYKRFDIIPDSELSTKYENIDLNEVYSIYVI